MKIGIILNHEEDLNTGLISSYSELREFAITAEDGGLDSIWVFDHLLSRFDGVTQGIWEGWTLLSALAEATERVELGTVVLCNGFRDPGLVAKMAHTLDEISNGRVILGLGAGWHEPEFDTFGFPFDHRVDRFEEALQIIPPLLRGERLTFEGTYYQVRDAFLKPLGPRPDGIPLLIGAGRPRMLRLTARYAAQWNTAWLGDPVELPPRLARIRTACDEVGRDPTTLEITVGISTAYPELGQIESFARNPLSGTAESLADAFHKYEEAGADHLIAQFTPSTLPALKRLVEAVRLYRG
jgi:alkanesulfonate monooxygenase SsuD/methylene tetrahydromethanopterin reductase-like flavin-dependent oxidoreductase (luciferase family)